MSQIYENPLVSRYASREMAELWSAQRKFSTWRKLWIILAKAQQELGLPISDEQISEMREKVEQIDFAAAAAYERKLRHDVMAHVHAYGDVAPSARKIIHLGATSCYVTDNADILLIREALEHVRAQLVGVILLMADFADRWKDQPCLGYTHFQPAQLVTVGKRATLWCQELVMDLKELERKLEDLKPLGVKGTTGTQASFLSLFDGDQGKVKALEDKVAKAMGFERCQPVSGQTYTRKVDTQVINALAGVAESGHRFGSDLRLLAHEREVEEPFEAHQIGSSAMAYKRNPMRAERLCSIARYLLALPAAAAQTSANQWLERTLDDSAVRRITLPHSFLCADAILSLYRGILDGMVVHPFVINQKIAQELPFMATEELIMEGVKAGGDRQDLHERIRVHSIAAANRLKTEGGSNDLVDRLKTEPAFQTISIDELLIPHRFIGRCPQQVQEFLEQEIEPIRQRYSGLASGTNLGRTIDL